MEHKELRQLLDAIVRSAKHSHERLGIFVPFGMTLSDEGTILKGLKSPRAQQSLEEGLSLLAQHGNCKAIGFCSDLKGELTIFGEHRDGSAFRIGLSLVGDILRNPPSNQLRPLRQSLGSLCGIDIRFWRAPIHDDDIEEG